MVTARNHLTTTWIFIVLFFLLSTVCLSAVIHYNMDDEVEINSFVGNLAADALLSSTSQNASVYERHSRLHFLFLSSPHNELFHLNSSTGDLRSSKKMDRDAMCASALECKLELNVQVTNEHLSSFVKVLIDLTDVNDNSPTFDQHSVQLNLSEAELVGRKILLARASDIDSPKNGIKRFTLRPEVDEFAIHLNNHTHDATNGNAYYEVFLAVKKPLDRERQASYQLNLITEDYGDPPRKAILPVSIALSDVNDNAPVFDREIYLASIEENSPISASVTQVVARDGDLGEGGVVIYGLEKKLNPSRRGDREGEVRTGLQPLIDDLDAEWDVWTDDEVGGPLFRVDKNTGLIYVAGNLDREVTSLHVLSVSARDLDSSRSKSVSTVKVEVSDVNDNPPIVSSQFSVYNVSENCGPKTFVGLLTVTDLDSADNTRLSCSTGNPTFVLESIIGNQYQLVTSSDSKYSQIDRETQEEYNILISCSDGSFPPLTGSLSLEIRVLDRNDNKPNFEANNYTIRLVENVCPKGAILKALAYDDDEGVNGMVRYKLETPRQVWYSNLDFQSESLSIPSYNSAASSSLMLDHLEVNEISGVLRVVKPFDREKLPVVRLLFAAYDLGMPPLTSYADVIIYIDDEDDEKPVFTQSNFTFSILENQPAGEPVGTVQAHDADEEPFNSFHYFMHQPDIFRVDPSTGSLTTVVSLDRELIDFYVFDVLACPTSGDVDCTSAHVTVRIADENDNTPRLIFPAPHLNYTLVITNSFQYGDRVTKIMAEDDDEPGLNSRLVYQALDTTYFRLNSTTGMVTASRTFAVSGEGTVCEFPIVVRDSGDPSKSAEVIVIFIFNSSVKSYFDLEREGNESNFYIVISIAVTSAFLSAILVVAILFVARKQTLPPACDGDKKSERARNGSKKKKESKSNNKNNNASSLKLRCQQPFPGRGAKNKNKTKKKKSSICKDRSNACNQVSAVSFNNGCLKNKANPQQLEGCPTLRKSEEKFMVPSKTPPPPQNLPTPTLDRLMDVEGKAVFTQNIPDVVDKVTTLPHPSTFKQQHHQQHQQHHHQQQQRHHCNSNNTTSLTTKMTSRPQLPLRTSGTLALGYYGDHATHHNTNSLRPQASAAEVKFKQEVVTKDPYYFTNCTASAAAFGQSPACYPNNEQKINYGSFV